MKKIKLIRINVGFGRTQNHPLQRKQESWQHTPVYLQHPVDKEIARDISDMWCTGTLRRS